jgi:hypothetical protein
MKSVDEYYDENDYKEKGVPLRKNNPVQDIETT